MGVTGLFGGAFDPPHNGHVELARAALPGGIVQLAAFARAYPAEPRFVTLHANALCEYATAFVFDDWEDAALVRLFASYLGAREGREIPMPGDALADSADEPFRLLRDHAVAAELVPADAEVEHVRSLYEAYKVGLRLGTQLLWRYRPRPYAGPITYFRAAEESAVLQEVFPAATSTWTGLTGASLEIHDVPGSHYTMFLPSHARTLAELLRQRL